MFMQDVLYGETTMLPSNVRVLEMSCKKKEQLRIV